MGWKSDIEKLGLCDFYRANSIKQKNYKSLKY